MSDTPCEESFLLFIQEGHLVNGVDLILKNVFLGPLDKLAAELDPHGYLLILNRPLVMAKLYRTVAAIGHRIDLEIPATHHGYQIICGMAVVVIISKDGLGIVGFIRPSRGGHERVNEPLKFLIVLVDVHNLLTGVIGDPHMNMQATSAIDNRMGLIQHPAAGLKGFEPIVIVIQDRGDALNGGLTTDRAIGDELEITPIIGMVITLIGEIEVRGRIGEDVGAAHIALNLHTEGQALLIEETRELQDFNVTLAES